MTTSADGPRSAAPPSTPGTDRSNPALTVEVTRADVVESAHVVSAVHVDASGAVVQYWGEPDRPIFPRSALKPVQALPLVTSGAADRFGLTPTELALATASHSAAPAHVAAVRDWLVRIGLDETHLECGPALPFGIAESHAHLAAGGRATRITNCCSGKHAGFLTLAVHMGWPTAGYIHAEHPVQQAVADAIATATDFPGGLPSGLPSGLSRDADTVGIDGCGIPAPAMALRTLAVALASLVARTGADAAATRIVDAMVAQPWFVAGDERTDTAIMQAANGALVAKIGAEGVAVSASRSDGSALAVKAHDGARRAADAAWVALLSGPAGSDLAPEAPVRTDAHATLAALRGPGAIQACDGRPAGDLRVRFGAG